MSDYIINSADSHVSEPRDLFKENVSRKFKDSVPRTIVEGEYECMYVEEELFSRRRIGNKKNFINMADSDTIPGGYDPEARLKDLERDGVWAEVLFPTSGLFVYRIQNQELSMECCRIYNDWLHAQLLQASPRFIGTALITFRDVDTAAAEIDRCGKLGYQGVNIPVWPPEQHNKPEYEPIWDAIERNNMVAAMHVGSVQHPTIEHGAGGVLINFMESGVQGVRALVYIIASGILERHPNTHVMMVEASGSWLAPIAERLDEAQEFHKVFIKNPMPLMPSEYIKRQVHVSTQHDSAALETLRVTGPDSIVFGTDYPHIEGTWPDTRQVLESVFNSVPGISEETKRAVAGGTLAKLYNIPEPPKAMAAE